jgi:hypothetical protein
MTQRVPPSRHVATGPNRTAFRGLDAIGSAASMQIK